MAMIAQLAAMVVASCADPVQVAQATSGMARALTDEVIMIGLEVSCSMDCGKGENDGCGRCPSASGDDLAGFPVKPDAVKNQNQSAAGA